MQKEWEQWPPIEGERGSGFAVFVFSGLAAAVFAFLCVVFLF